MLKIAARIAPLVVLASVIALGVLEYRVAPPPVVIGIQLLAIGLAVWARSAFPPRAFRAGFAPGGDTLVRRGPYAFIRHPMYAAAFTLIWAGLLAQRPRWAIPWAVVVTAFGAARILVEERALRAHFADYAEYARVTKAVIPWLL